MDTLTNELKKLLSSFEEAQIDYAVCGGLALTIHGFPRATFDIDLLIQEASLEKAIKAALRMVTTSRVSICHLRSERLRSVRSQK